MNIHMLPIIFSCFPAYLAGVVVSGNSSFPAWSPSWRPPLILGDTSFPIWRFFSSVFPNMGLGEFLFMLLGEGHSPSIIRRFSRTPQQSLVNFFPVFRFYEFVRSCTITSMFFRVQILPFRGTFTDFEILDAFYVLWVKVFPQYSTYMRGTTSVFSRHCSGCSIERLHPEINNIFFGEV